MAAFSKCLFIALLGNSAPCPQPPHRGWPGGIGLRGGHHLPELGQIVGPIRQDVGARWLPVRAAWASIMPFSWASPASVSHPLHLDDFGVDAGGEGAFLIQEVGQPAGHPAPTLRPTRPSTTMVPPVMYSQQWSPAPSITACPLELRTAKRSPAMPRA
jgi:hypothetical protein